MHLQGTHLPSLNRRQETETTFSPGLAAKCARRTSATASTTEESDLQNKTKQNKKALSFLEVGVQQPGYFEKPNAVTPSEYLLQFLIADYYLLVVWILCFQITKRMISCLATKFHNPTISATTRMHLIMAETREPYLIRNSMRTRQS